MMSGPSMDLNVEFIVGKRVASAYTPVCVPGYTPVNGKKATVDLGVVDY